LPSQLKSPAEATLPPKPEADEVSVTPPLPFKIDDKLNILLLMQPLSL
jgi:hypothetical protein